MHVVCLNACLFGGHLASPSQRTAPGAMLEVPNQKFFFKSSSHSGQPSPPHGPAGALPAWAGGLAGRGGGPERDLAAFVSPSRG